MPRLPVNSLRTSLGVLLLGLALSGQAADKEKDKPASLMGATKEQVYSRLGEPPSVMKAGVREVMFFPKVKVTLRNGVVIETEEMFEDAPPPPPAPVKRAPEAPVAAPLPANSTDSAEPLRNRQTGAAASVTPVVGAATENAAAANPTEAPADVRPAPPTTGNGGLEIKFVRAPAAKAPRPTAGASAAPKSVTTIPAPAKPPAAGATSVATSPMRPATPLAPAAALPPAMVPAASAVAVATSSRVVAEPVSAKKPDDPVEPRETTAAEEATEKAKPKTPAKGFFRRGAAGEVELPAVPWFTTQTVVLAIGVAGALAYLMWRSRQRALELAATTVSNTPFSEPVAVDNSALFNGEFLAKLEWKRFEELVALYYIKTGVVAVRTKTGPDSPVHLKISWKGETKPFACVQCHANPPGLIRSEPLQALALALAGAEIRRGYVVTNGKFNVEARDLAEEKHFTLLPGDILLEKLNALPPMARIELMQEMTKGDYTTPTCPKCDVKMVRSGPDGWRCANYPKCEVVLPARKT